MDDHTDHDSTAASEENTIESEQPQEGSATVAEPQSATESPQEAVPDAEPAEQPIVSETAETDVQNEADEAAEVEAESEAVTQSESEDVTDDVEGAAKPRIPWWPFLIYLAAWIALIGAAFYLIAYGPEAPPAFQQDDYPYILIGGLVLTVLGPLLAFLVWLIKWLRTPKGERGGLLTSALLKGALMTCLGVLAWWGAIVVLDALRLGLIGPIG